MGLRVPEGEVHPLGIVGVVALAVVRGEAGERGGADQLVKGGGIRLHQEFGGGHLRPAEGVPEAQLRPEEEVEAVDVGEAELRLLGQGVVRRHADIEPLLHAGLSVGKGEGQDGDVAGAVLPGGEDLLVLADGGGHHLLRLGLAALAQQRPEGGRDTVDKAVHTSVLLSLLGSAAVAGAGELLAAPVLGLLNVPQEVFPLALLYLRIYLAGMPVILLYNFEAAIFRSVGETRVPLMALATSGVLNVALNLFFVAVLGMTVNGVAIATVLSNAVSSVLLFRRLRRGVRDIRLEPRRLRIDGPTLRRILRIGLPAGIQSAVFAVSNIVIQSAVNSLGTVVMAASSAAFNIEIFTYDILNSFSQACTTFVGQNFGAGQIDRCKKTLFLCLAEGAIFLGAAIALLLTFGKPLLAIFNQDPEVIDTGYIRLMMVMLSHSFSLLYEVMSGYLRGFGVSLTPAVLTMLGVCGVRISWVHWVFPGSRTFRTIMMAYPISLSATALMIFLALLICRPARRFAQGQRVGDAA